MSVALIIPFRDRGTDPLRQANREHVFNCWYEMGYHPQMFDDGREGDAQFNRSAAYNQGIAANPDAEVFIFAESDMIVSEALVEKAIQRAREHPGLVVPFSQYVALTPHGSAYVRAGMHPATEMASYVMADCRAVGAVNVVSRESMELVGRWDEKFEGSWWDDTSMEIAFQTTCGATYFVEGVAYHLFHRPGWTGDHLTEEDKAASQRNEARYQLYRKAHSPEQIRALTMETTE